MFEIDKFKKILKDTDCMNVLNDQSNSILEIASIKTYVEAWAQANKKIIIATATAVIILSASSLLLKDPIVMIKNGSTGKMDVLLNPEKNISYQLEMREDDSIGHLVSGLYYVDENHAVLNEKNEKIAVLVEAEFDALGKQFLLSNDDLVSNNHYLKSTVHQMFEEYLLKTVEKQDETDDYVDEISMTEEQIYIQKYSDIFGLDSEIVYQTLSDLTNHFTDDAYVNDYVIGDSKLKKRDVSCTNKEMAILIAIRNMYHDPERYGYLGDVSDLKTGTLYQSDSDYAQQIAEVSDVLGIDAALNYALCESITNFNGELFLENHNPGGLVFDGNYAVFPSDMAGFIEQSLELLKHQLDGRYTIEEISRQYVPFEPAATTLISKVTASYHIALENYDTLFGNPKEAVIEVVQESQDEVQDGVSAIIFEKNHLKQIMHRIILEDEEHFFQEYQSNLLNSIVTPTSTLEDDPFFVMNTFFEDEQEEMLFEESDVPLSVEENEMNIEEEEILETPPKSESFDDSIVDSADSTKVFEDYGDASMEQEESSMDGDFDSYDSSMQNTMDMLYEEYLDDVDEADVLEDEFSDSAAQWVCEHYGMSASELETFANSFIQTSQKLETGFYDKLAVYNYLYEISQVSNAEKELFVMENLGLTEDQFRTVVNTFIGEAAHSYADGYGVASVGILRCASAIWIRSHGTNIYDQVTAPGQFTVYLAGIYLSYDQERDSIRYQGILDALYSGCPSHTYGNFEAAFTERQLFQFVSDGNRYGRMLGDLDTNVLREAAAKFLEIPQDAVLTKEIN